MTTLKRMLQEIEAAPPRDPAEVLARALAEMEEQEQSTNGICPYWRDCHASWKYTSRQNGRVEWKHVSDDYKCAWRLYHRVSLCGTYRRRRGSSGWMEDVNDRQHQPDSRE